MMIAPTAQTHQYLQPTIDVLAWRQNVAVSALHGEVAAVLADMSLPHGYSIHYEGEYKQMAESGGRLVKAFALGLILLYLMLTVTFRSFLDPVAIMACLPLALIGAAFGLILNEGRKGSASGNSGISRKAYAPDFDDGNGCGCWHDPHCDGVGGWP